MRWKTSATPRPRETSPQGPSMAFVLRTQLATALLVISLGTLIGCQTTIPSVATSAAFCDVAKPITYSMRDTPETRAQILSHNAAFVALCSPETEKLQAAR